MCREHISGFINVQALKHSRSLQEAKGNKDFVAVFFNKTETFFERVCSGFAILMY